MFRAGYLVRSCRSTTQRRPVRDASRNARFPPMTKRHKNKTIATLLAALFGAIGLHRFYLYRSRDRWAWGHLLSLPLSWLAWKLWPEQPWLFTGGLLVASALAGFLEALVIGLTP